MPGPYQLYLIRHGIAEERGPDWPDDGKRPLTSEGISRMKRAANGLVRLGVSLDVVLTSPLVRARQTAEAVAGAFDARPPIVVIESLSPDGTHDAVVSDLEKQSRRLQIALVGHEPRIGELAARLIGTRRPIEFKKGAVCRIDVETMPPGGSGSLRWLMTPKILRRLRR